MASPTRKPDAFYYSSGERVSLVADERLVAVDVRVAAKLGAAKGAQPLKGDLVLLDTSDLSPPGAAGLRKMRGTGEALDVFDADGARMVVMPEIRIEVDRPADGKRISDWLASRSDLDVVARGDEVYEVRLKSGGSRRALELANEIWEKFHPAVAHPRFLRIVPKPRTMR